MVFVCAQTAPSLLRTPSRATVCSALAWPLPCVAFSVRCVCVQATPAFAANLLVRLALNEGTGATSINAGTTAGTATLSSSALWGSQLETCPPLLSAPSSFVTFDAVGEAVAFPKTPAMM